MLPPLAHIVCSVTWTDPVTNTPQQHRITLAELGLRPIDALYLLKPDKVQVMAELDDRIQRLVVANWNPRPDAQIAIQYLAATSGPNEFSIFESAPLLRNLRSHFTNSRPLRASDVQRANDASQQDNSNVFVDQSRIATPLATLTTLAGDIDTFVNGTLAPLLADTTANRTQIIANVDSFLAKAVELLERAALLALPSSGWGFLYSWRQTAFADLLAAVADLIQRWTQKLSNFNTALNTYDALPASTSGTIRMDTLNKIELLVSSQLDPTLNTPAALRAALPGKAGSFQTRLGEFQAIAASNV